MIEIQNDFENSKSDFSVINKYIKIMIQKSIFYGFYQITIIKENKSEKYYIKFH